MTTTATPAPAITVPERSAGLFVVRLLTSVGIAAGMMAFPLASAGLIPGVAVAALAGGAALLPAIAVAAASVAVAHMIHGVQAERRRQREQQARREQNDANRDAAELHERQSEAQRQWDRNPWLPMPAAAEPGFDPFTATGQRPADPEPGDGRQPAHRRRPAKQELEPEVAHRSLFRRGRCGIWMPRAHKRCVLAAGHRKGHRSALPR